ncbi:hypothetical protein EBR03_04330 [bacterium]|nr:hypothetical protein [bacterium]
MLQQLSSITTQMGDLRRNLYPSMPSQQPSTGEVAAPAMTPAPKDASAPAETAPTATTFSPENPYAEKAIKEQKLGKVEYKVEKAGILHTVIGKKSFGTQKLKENFAVLYENILKAKPSTSKGVYIRKVALAPTMGPSVIVDPASAEALARGL